MRYYGPFKASTVKVVRADPHPLRILLEVDGFFTLDAVRWNTVKSILNLCSNEGGYGLTKSELIHMSSMIPMKELIEDYLEEATENSVSFLFGVEESIYHTDGEIVTVGKAAGSETYKAFRKEIQDFIFPHWPNASISFLNTTVTTENDSHLVANYPTIQINSDENHSLQILILGKRVMVRGRYSLPNGLTVQPLPYTIINKEPSKISKDLLSETISNYISALAMHWYIRKPHTNTQFRGVSPKLSLHEQNRIEHELFLSFCGPRDKIS
tara:strand:- start:24273 stop:25079 length:807 start_codon:yes stop_codon:yes gene_type:complete